MKVAGFQMDIEWHNRDANHQKISDAAAKAKELGAELLALPEMCSTGFSMDTNITPETLDGPTPSLFRSIAREKGIAVAGGFVLSRWSGRPQNVSLVVDRNGNDLALYAKIHQIAILDEHNHYDPGTRPVTFSLEGTGAACFVCYDLRFPEIFRAVVDRCGLMMVIASWPASRQLHWDVLLRARAIESQCFMIGVNRTGIGAGLEFTGGSAIIDPLGNILAHGGEKEGLVIADLDLKKVAEARSTMPFLKDRIPDLALRSSE
ncbi:MAG: carbon-nitrogen family hydrolase [Desulfobacteraceae bacterium]|jgi:predicted amidohydrolase|nr:MAG: carbon-nitrogen family hydrolase [Desulfobacteraceae bacterium]